MPRVLLSAVRAAQAIDPLLARLLPVCRTIESARNELRWLREHVASSNGALRDAVNRRARGEPLQYIIGSEFFGDLEIRCRPQVLIPRQETAASVTHLVRRLQIRPDKRLRVLDLCTGSGCIPLLFHHEFYRKQRDTALNIVGVDASQSALDLAVENLNLQQDLQSAAVRPESKRVQSLRTLQFTRADVLARDSGLPSIESILDQMPEHDRYFDVLISNPPYVSDRHYKTITAASVRRFEPRMALVPQIQASMTTADGDQFYPRLWQIADLVKAKLVLFEVGDHDQATRVASMGTERGQWQTIEIWRDDPSSTAEQPSTMVLDHKLIPVVGSGNSRSVFAIR